MTRRSAPPVSFPLRTNTAHGTYARDAYWRTQLTLKQLAQVEVQNETQEWKLFYAEKVAQLNRVWYEKKIAKQ